MNANESKQVDGQVDERKNPFEGKRELMDELLAYVKARGVNAAMLHAWDTAKSMEAEAAELSEPDEPCGVWEAFDGVVDCLVDGREAREFVIDEYEDVGDAMVVLYGERPNA